MMKSYTNILLAIFLVMAYTLGVFQIGHAQQADDSQTKTKIVIIKKTVDENGNETIEKIVKEGDDLSDEDIDSLIDEEENDLDWNIFSEGDELIINGRQFNIEDLKQLERLQDMDFDFDFDFDYPEDLNFNGLENQTWNYAFGSASDRPFLGVKVNASDEGGMMVQEVIEDTGAEKAGIQAGDLIIAVDGNAVLSYNGLVSELQKHEVGDEVEIRLEREGQEMFLTATLGESKAQASSFLPRGFNHDNMEMIPGTIEKRAFLGIYPELMDDGVKITRLVEGEAAEKAGLQEGDVITAIGESKLTKSGDLTKALSELEPGTTVKVSYLRDGAEQSANVVLGERKTKMKLHGYVDPGMFEKHSWGGFNEKEFPHGNLFHNRASKPKLGVHIEKSDVRAGVNVNKVTEGSKAEQAGIQKGDIIFQFNDTEIETPEALIKAVQSAGEGTHQVKYERDGKTHSAEVEFEKAKQPKAIYKSFFPNRHNGVEYKSMVLRHHPTPSLRDRNISDDDSTLELASFSAYPNPANGYLTLQFEASSTEPVAVRISDLSGQQVFSEKVSGFDGNYDKYINVSEFANGLYLIHVIQDKQVFTEKLMLNNN